MRRTLAIIAVTFELACGGSAKGEACTRTDRGDGTTVITCGASKELVCTNPGCSGIMNVAVVATDLTRVNLSALGAVGRLSLSGNGALSSVDVSALTTIHAFLSVDANPVLTTLVLPSLVAAGDVTVGGNAGLTSVSLPALTTVGDVFTLDGNGALTAVNVPVLATIGGNVTVSSDAALTSFGFPVLGAIGGVLAVDFNAALTGFSFPALTALGGPLDVRNNVVLPECLAMAFKDHLVAAHAFTAGWNISGNDTTAICPP